MKDFVKIVLLQNEAENFGVDWEGPVPREDGDETVCVPETACPLSDADMEELLSVVPPLAQSEHYGIDLYERTVLFVSQKLGCATDF